MGVSDERLTSLAAMTIWTGKISEMKGTRGFSQRSTTEGVENTVSIGNGQVWVMDDGQYLNYKL